MNSITKVTICIVMSSAVSSNLLCFDESIPCNNLKSYCDEHQYSMGSDGSLSSIQKIWSAIIKCAKQGSLSSEESVALMREALKRAQARYAELNERIAQLPTPSRNVSVEGMPVSGMSIDQIDDPKVKEKYANALQANNAAIALANEKKLLGDQVRQMLSDSETYLKSTQAQGAQNEDFGSFLEEAKRLLKP